MAISSPDHTSNLRDTIRVWMYLMTNKKSIENKVIENLSKSNSKEAWFNLRRYPIK